MSVSEDFGMISGSTGAAIYVGGTAGVTKRYINFDTTKEVKGSAIVEDSICDEMKCYKNMQLASFSKIRKCF